MRHVVILGANGQLGTDLRGVLPGCRVTGLTHADMDVCDGNRVEQVLRELRPNVVVNTTAFHKVDVCEDEPAPPFNVNAIAVYGLARASAALDCTLIHFSSDYVFDGLGSRAYSEDDLPNPVNVYGASKLAGEHLVRRFAPRHFVIRTTGLFGVAGASGKGGNFVETMIRLGRSGNPVRVVNDQVMTPTATADLAAAVAALIAREDTVPYGLYHVTNSGECSWFHFAKTIFEHCGLRVDLAPITTAESGAKARRPPYSVLAHHRWTAAGMTELRPWNAALGDYLRAKGYLRT